MFRASQHPSSGVLKTVTAASGTGHNISTATSLQCGQIGPILLYLVGLLFNTNYDARNHELKKQAQMYHLCNSIHYAMCKYICNIVWFSLQIAGAGRGVGRELAIQFSMLGATVICWDIQSDINEETAVLANLLGYGVGKAYAYTCDITNRDQVNETVFISLTWWSEL